ncbi:hypothetical protein ACM64Y_14600 [Novispirillum sp. DQ9]|uniref:hypothetical protein n=1 Tax=Novispirillum sp. DQ9 TaxID=3398612 RepID=UPI003C7C5309
MKAYLFSASEDDSRKVVSARDDGAGLPPCPAGVWRPEGHVDMDVPGGGSRLPGAQAGIDRAAVRAGLERDGYHLFTQGGAGWAGRSSDL